MINSLYGEILIARKGVGLFDGFLNLYNLKNIVKDKTCFKSLKNPSGIDLFLTNCNISFQYPTLLSVGISDHHKMVVATVMKTTFVKSGPKDVLYRDYKHFDNNFFRENLKKELGSYAENMNICSHFEKNFSWGTRQTCPNEKENSSSK